MWSDFPSKLYFLGQITKNSLGVLSFLVCNKGSSVTSLVSFLVNLKLLITMGEIINFSHCINDSCYYGCHLSYPSPPCISLMDFFIFLLILFTGKPQCVIDTNDSGFHNINSSLQSLQIHFNTVYVHILCYSNLSSLHI